MKPKPEDRASRRIRWLVVSAIILVVSAALAAGVLAFRRHVTEGREFCRSCHADADQHIRSPAHQDMSCTACHDASFWPNARQYFAGSGKYVPHGGKDTAACKECHAGREEDRELLAKLGGHASHVLDAKMACSECHGGKTHVESFRPETCAKCHDNVEFFQTAVGNASCTSCHAYSLRRERDDRQPLQAPECRRCHHDPEVAARYDEGTVEVSADMVHGSLGTCGLCHNPHEPSPNAQLVVPNCATCHASVAKKLAASAKVASHGDCTTCHQPHAERDELRSLCASCHTEATADSIPAALSSHHEDCADCHHDHDFVPDRDDCARCHQDQNRELLGWDSGEHANCLNCHLPHVERKPEANCEKCHRDHTGHKHEACTTCHAPHSDKSHVKPCTGCHSRQVSQIARSPAASDHRACASCHVTHAPATTPARCAKCHESEVRLVGTAPMEKHTRCASCHQPHGFPATTAACRSCHQADQLGHHDKDCENCHNLHGPPKRGPANCVGCHDNVKPAAGKHSECTSCHSVHAAEQGPNCADCHQERQAAVKTWPNDKHRECSSCHIRHDDAPPKSCSSCHADKTTKFKATGHECRTCHDPHASPQPWWTTCSGCHQAQVTATRGRVPEHTNCQFCHNPHEPKQIRQCTSCHSGLGGAHGFKEHRNCTQCHTDPHSARPPNRETCLACHDKMEDHHPEARDCASCHPFQ